MENKTLSHLNSKVWYRFIKVLYVFFFLIIVLIFNLIVLDDGIMKWYQNKALTEFIEFLFIGNLIILLFFEILKGTFYYIVLGKFRPEK